MHTRKILVLAPAHSHTNMLDWLDFVKGLGKEDGASKSLTIDGAGHWIAVFASQATNSAIKAWIR